MDSLKNFGAMALIFLIVYGFYAWEKMRYDDCRKVGHRTLYCLSNLGK